MLTLGFAGLPSAGKSTMVNALAGKRVLESGVCRTTTEACLVGSLNIVGAPKWVETDLVSDDGVEFCALDLPGICDAEDTSGAFDAVTHEWAARCDVVVWVTDARTAFLTTHETREFTDMRRALEKIAEEDGKLFQLCILLAKYESDDVPASAAGAAGASSAVKARAGEITRPTEHSTIEDHEARIRGLTGLTGLTGPAVVLAKFSAYDRIAHSASASVALKALVVSSPGSTAHTTFNLKWATDGLPERRLAQMKRALCAAKSRAAEGSVYQAELMETIKTSAAIYDEGGIRLVDVVELGRRAASTVLARAWALAIPIYFAIQCWSVFPLPRNWQSATAIVIFLATIFAISEDIGVFGMLDFASACLLAFFFLGGLLKEPFPPPEFLVLLAITASRVIGRAGPVPAITCSVSVALLFLASYSSCGVLARMFLVRESLASCAACACRLESQLAYFRWAAEKGHAESLERIGAMYAEGRGVKADQKAARAYFLRAAQRGRPASWDRVRNHQRGEVATKPRGSVPFVSSILKGILVRYFVALGDMRYQGKGVSLDFAKSAGWYLKAAEQGSAYSQASLGRMYYYGRGVTLDFAESVKWYREAAEQGDLGSQKMLGCMYLEGRGVAHDLAESAKWHRKAAEQGDLASRKWLGLLCSQGKGTADFVESAEWFRRAAQGDAASQKMIGDMFYKGKSVALDLAEAARWYHKAAEQGDLASQVSLGDMYYQGKGVALNVAESVKWYRNAADQGDQWAQNWLGDMDHEGKGRRA